MLALRQRLGRITWDLLMGSAVGLLCGLTSGAFLWALERVLGFRRVHPSTLVLLPLLGLLSAFLYRRWGHEAEGGTALVLDEAMEWQGGVPSRMAPLVLVGTLLSHLGGASVGREGTAVQMGAALASSLSKLPGRLLALLRLTRTRRRLLLQAGLAGGFGSVFGTPLAGTLFGLEVVRRGGIATDALLVCLSASLLGDRVVRSMGLRHATWTAKSLPGGVVPLLALLAFALVIALVAWLYLHASHGLAGWTKGRFAWWMRPLLGGVGFVLMCIWVDPLHLNLGTEWLPRIFIAGTVPLGAFAVKLLLTAWCLGWGFKGGEVTPLFVSGALLGAATAPFLGLPPTGLAAVGLVTLFATASHTPLAGLLLGVELFGAGFAAPILLVGGLAYALVGQRSLYRAGGSATMAS
jgi:H+/Cl- antiporter ClcA